MSLWLGTVASSIPVSSAAQDVITLGGGGYSSVSTSAIYKTNIKTGADLTLWASTSWARYSMGSASNSTTSLAIGGHRSSSTSSDSGGNTFYRIDSTLFATSGTGSYFGGVRLAGNGYSGTGDSTYGYIYGGDCCGSSTYRSLRDRVSFSSGGTSQNWGSSGPNPSNGTCSNNGTITLYAYWQYSGGTIYYNNIHYATNNTSGNTTSFANISSPGRQLNLSSSKTEAFTFGGYYYSGASYYVSQIDKINYSTAGVTQSFGSVRNGTTIYPLVTGSETEALQFTYPSSQKTYDKFSYSTGGTSTLFKTYGAVGAYEYFGAPTSDCHGGIS